MGKSKIVKILGRFIGNVTAHKILNKYGNRPEAFHHTESEIIAYRDSALEAGMKVNLNQYDKEKIKQESLKSFEKELKKPHFNNVKFPMEKARELLNQTMQEIIL